MGIIKRLKEKKQKGYYKAICSYMIDIEGKFAQFSYIESCDDKYDNVILYFTEEKLYPEVVEKYNNTKLLINKHNFKIQEIASSLDKHLENCSINDIVDNVLLYSLDDLNEISSDFQKLLEYELPTFDGKCKKYQDYHKKLKKIISIYDVLSEQKKLMSSIDALLHPDRYLDLESAKKLVKELRQLTTKYQSYPKRYYNIKLPTIKVGEFINKNNIEYIERHIYDDVFDDVNGYKLDEDQRRAILCDPKANLVVAGAGSGKTLTICGKVKYLLEMGMAKPNEILLLSYSKKSADDLREKVKKISNSLTVETFHALGLKILTADFGFKKAVEDQFDTYIQNFIAEEISKDSNVAKKMFDFIALYFYADKQQDEPYKDEGERFKALKTMDFQTLKTVLYKATRNKEDFETFKHEHVKSLEELVIANYLFINGINYIYEHNYEHQVGTLYKRQYTPDFYLPDYGIYLEHYGINQNGETPQYGPEASRVYKESMAWKRDIHKEYGTVCLETFSYEFRDGTLFDKLKRKLEAKGVEYNPLTEEEIHNVIIKVCKGRRFESFASLMGTVLALYKSQYVDDSGFEMLKKNIKGSRYNKDRISLFFDLCKALYNYYIRCLRDEDKVDFDDMILQSTDALEHLDEFKYKYVIVDEYQDISQSRNRLLNKLIEHGDSKLFVVGDDWQAIYRFVGCDIGIFLNFKKSYEDSKINFINATHRNSTDLLKIVEPFITANPSQFKKNIKSEKREELPVRLFYHSMGDDGKASAFKAALKEICDKQQDAKVLVLGRNRRDIGKCLCDDITISEWQYISYSDCPNLTIEYSTVHRAKGLESDFVILLNAEDVINGFPNKMDDDEIVSMLLVDKEPFPYAEERRLFYVALTRTKSIVYVLVEEERPSQFIKEIKSKCHIEYIDVEPQSRHNLLCPDCKSGHLLLRKHAKNGSEFYGCSNFPYCKYTIKEKETVEQQLRCPVCGDYLLFKEGPYGKFYGCHSYPICTYRLNIESKYK